ncbi:HAD family phosphatase [Erysipelotrichaceae bacterium RD49]|nr:HAD family phosphatase [Erysipelotrichaceae bacterium RD49]
MIKSVIFDFNGTLFLDNDKHVKAWSQISQILRGRPITEQELHEKMNGVNNVQIVRYLNHGNEEPALEEEYSLKKEALYRQFCQEDVENFHLIKGAEALFDDLKASRIPFTIASASIKPNIDFFVESFHLDKWIDPATIVYDDGTYPDKEAMFKEAAKRLHRPIEEFTVIEDSFAGVSNAIKAGVQDIRLLDSGHIAPALGDIPQIRQVVEDMSEIER